MYQAALWSPPVDVGFNDRMTGSTADTEPPQAPDAMSVWDAAADAYRRWRAGDRFALDTLVRTLTPVLWHAARSYGLSEEATRDVLQNAWLRLVRDPGQVRDAQAVGAWLLTTTRRLAWRTCQAREIPVEECRPARAEIAPSPEDVVVARSEADELWQAVDTLNARCQRLLRIVAFVDRPDYAALSAEIGMPIGSLGPTRRRCLDKLRSTLDRGRS